MLADMNVIQNKLRSIESELDLQDELLSQCAENITKIEKEAIQKINSINEQVKLINESKIRLTGAKDAVLDILQDIRESILMDSGEDANE